MTDNIHREFKNSRIAKIARRSFYGREMPTVAEQLRQGREAQNLTVNRAAEITKIKTDHLRALEEGNYEAFSAPVYIRGFARSYAMLLKLDVTQFMATLDAELAQTQKFREPPSLIPQKHGWLDFFMLQLSKLNWRVLVAVVAVIGVAGLVMVVVRFWTQHPAKDPLSDLGPGLYQTPSNEVSVTLPLPTNTVAPRK